MTEKPRTPAERAAQNPHSLRAAINAKCWECTSRSCPLHALRPWQGEAEDDPQDAHEAASIGA